MRFFMDWRPLETYMAAKASSSGHSWRARIPCQDLLGARTQVTGVAVGRAAPSLDWMPPVMHLLAQMRTTTTDSAPLMMHLLTQIHTNEVATWRSMYLILRNGDLCSMTYLNSIYVCLFPYCKRYTLLGIFAKKKRNKRNFLIINRAIWCSATNQVLIPQHWSWKFSCLQLQLLLWSFAHYPPKHSRSMRRHLWTKRNSHKRFSRHHIILCFKVDTSDRQTCIFLWPFFFWNWHHKRVIAAFVLSCTFPYEIIIRLSCLARRLPLGRKVTNSCAPNERSEPIEKARSIISKYIHNTQLYAYRERMWYFWKFK